MMAFEYPASIFNPFLSYNDEQITPYEAESSLRRVLAALQHVRPDRPVLITEVEIENPPEGKAHLFLMIRAFVDVAWLIQPSPRGYEMIEQGSIFLWDATTKLSPLLLTGTA